MIGLTPDITAVSVVRHGMLRVTFADGLEGEVEVLDRMRGPVFADARTDAGFALARVDAESGTVVWPGGADLAPDTLYARVRTGLWPEQDAAALGSVPVSGGRIPLRGYAESPRWSGYWQSSVIGAANARMRLRSRRQAEVLLIEPESTVLITPRGGANVR